MKPLALLIISLFLLFIGCGINTIVVNLYNSTEPKTILGWIESGAAISFVGSMIGMGIGWILFKCFKILTK